MSHESKEEKKTTTVPLDEKATIKAFAAKTKAGKLEAWSYHPRQLGDTDVEVKITHCGICASDIHTIDSGWGPSSYPVVPGHEIIGIVTKAGKGCKNLKVGDRVGVGAQCFACHKNTCHDCMTDDDPHCPDHVFTYDGKFADGHTSYGGYAEAVRVFEDFAFKIPDAIDSASAAPLLCAGATVWKPLVDHNVKWGSKVAVVGLGGLGHLAVQMAAKMGAEVTVVTSTAGKSDDSKKMGATHVLVRTDEKQMKAAMYTQDVVIITSNQEGQNYNELLSLCKTRGVCVLCAASNDGVKFHPFSLIMKNVQLCGSLIASSGQIRQMLDFCAKTGVRPIIEKMPMKNVNDGIEKVRNGKVRYRVVLENPSQ